MPFMQRYESDCAGSMVEHQYGGWVEYEVVVMEIKEAVKAERERIASLILNHDSYDVQLRTKLAAMLDMAPK